MSTNDEDRFLEVLGDAECRRLLGTVRVGRLGFTDAALPAILPVPFSVVDDCIRIPAREGNRVLDAVRRSVVAFAVDSYDDLTRTGWGVTVVGPAHVVPDGPRGGRQGGPGAPGPGRSIVVQLGLLRGWRLGDPAGLPSSPTRVDIPNRRPTDADGGAGMAVDVGGPIDG
ncbi:pyridoxamine 5'-phosphate oxidase family protein [Blastococcus tunisiensis]|uniref:Pyridoxamine 5'-phosphate oxidase n=1 Tax=Blastococcus tunisiensis TaxID=1798228 RepID=A0A1I2E101_9ACTN|nr:pyridoxamine 5'-phosphate oxidase family protein [Blastococcus sp. DSM 46838]SFE86564.1 Pyridoxamine 5'-phosphate oxidase [Blastococcus sp. DSM 46838]